VSYYAPNSEAAVDRVQFYGGPRKEQYEMYNFVLTDLNISFTILFTIEMILKLLAFGIRVRSRLIVLTALRHSCDFAPSYAHVFCSL